MIPTGAGRATSAAVMSRGTISVKHVGLAHPAGDQLGVLGAEVDDQDPVDGPASGLTHAHADAAGTAAGALPSVWRAGATITSAFWNSLTSA